MRGLDPDPLTGPATTAEPLPRYRGGLRIVVAHDFLLTFGGAERILREMIDALGAAEVWAIAADSRVGSQLQHEDGVRTVLPASRLLAKHYRLLTPALPTIVRRTPLPEADVLVTSSYAFAHGFATRNEAPQVCVCHSPLRFAWTATDEYRRRWARLPGTKRAFGAIAAAMRTSDRRAARRVGTWVTYSQFVQPQIKEFYGAEPVRTKAPVDIERFHPANNPDAHDGYFLFCGRLIEPYKRPTALIDAFRALPESQLIVAGGGPELERLRRQASPNVRFLGQVGDDELVPLMQRCAATIFPSRDDLGLVPLEVMACGRPVIAFAGGGALETMAPGTTGELLHEATASAIAAAVRRFDPDAYDSGAVRAHADQWDRRIFRRDLIDVVTRAASSAKS